ncbi:putative 39S ribosomal protein L47, mitochondrial [Hypsibius exemplaris]|uniref:Large ribosomal subunit protein uL29m n=1 Tax=Hypsibius exemplaris TaxID=2072580 RepID=A0A1W0WFB8_HYPEX|nr:putative 39S ribosomal protein L47, mitochondrial [Hypsibius exemplaris]
MASFALTMGGKLLLKSFCNFRSTATLFPFFGLVTPSKMVFQISHQAVLFHTSSRRYSLMEFFDDKKNWGAKEVRSGRSWSKDELRIKSNIDLHKLWFVLYKEKNMLLTMEEECERVIEPFPNPERRYRVEESMTRLQEVIKERDRAVKLLQVGITGEPPSRECYGLTGQRYRYIYQEHLMPYWRNPRHFKRRYTQEKPLGMMRKFILLMQEKKRKERWSAIKKEQAKIHAAANEYPDHPFWLQEEREISQLRLKDVYHTKMSD